MDVRNTIAKRAAALLRDGDLVNLGIGIPTLCTSYLPPDVRVMLHSENGIIGMAAVPQGQEPDKYTVDAGSSPAAVLPGGACFDIGLSFAIMRGGHLDRSIVVALQADVTGSFASWEIPGKRTYGMGGAMDLAVGAKELIVAMEHRTRGGAPRILEKCTFPLTGRECVKYIVTELCTFKCEAGRLYLPELADGVSTGDVLNATAAPVSLDMLGEISRAGNESSTYVDLQKRVGR